MLVEICHERRINTIYIDVIAILIHLVIDIWVFFCIKGSSLGQVHAIHQKWSRITRLCQKAHCIRICIQIESIFRGVYIMKIALVAFHKITKSHPIIQPSAIAVKAGRIKIICFTYLFFYYYCPLNLEFIAHACAWRKFGLTLERESALLVIFAVAKQKQITKSWAKVHIFSDSRYWVSC